MGHARSTAWFIATLLHTDLAICSGASVRRDIHWSHALFTNAWHDNATITLFCDQLVLKLVLDIATFKILE